VRVALAISLLVLMTGMQPARAAEVIGQPNFTEPQANRLMALQVFLDQDLDLSEFDPLVELWEGESNWMTRAKNPNSSAVGIPQAMGSLYPETQTEEWMNSPRTQIEWGLDYIMGRYGTVAKALEHKRKHGWY
jgi:hypothetical protein